MLMGFPIGFVPQFDGGFVSRIVESMNVLIIGVKDVIGITDGMIGPINHGDKNPIILPVPLNSN